MGTQPLDIFFFSRVLQEKLPGFIAQVDDRDVAAIDLAIPDILADVARLNSEVFPSLDGIPQGDLDKLGDALTSFHEVLLHTKEQVEVAERALCKLVDACTVSKM